MKTTEARPHADAGQELWNVKEGVRLSIQQRAFPEAASFICFIAEMHKWNSSAFFLPFAAIT